MLTERQRDWPWRHIEERMIDWLPAQRRVKRLLAALWKLRERPQVETVEGADGDLVVEASRVQVLSEMRASQPTFYQASADAEAAGWLIVDHVAGRANLYTLRFRAIFRASDLGAAPESARTLRTEKDARAPRNSRKTGTVRASGAGAPAPPAASLPESHLSKTKTSGPDRTGPGFLTGENSAHSALPDWPELRELVCEHVEPLPANSLQHSVFAPLQLHHLQQTRPMLEWHRRQLSADWPAVGPTVAEATLVVAAAVYATTLPEAQVRRTRVGLFVDIVSRRKWWRVRNRIAEAGRRVGRALQRHGVFA